MSSSLIPERPLLISPTLAATIGLEEAVMLHVLSEMKLRLPVSLRDNLRWLEVNLEMLSDAMPFWNIADIMRIQQSLLEKGLVQVDGGGSQKGYFKIAINETGLSRKASGVETSAAPAATKNPPHSAAHASPSHASTPQVSLAQTAASKAPPANPFHQTPSSGKASQIPDHWQPSEDLYQLCSRRNIPRDFIDEHVRLFVISQQERRKAQYSWHNTFYKYILREWELSRSHRGLKELEANMSADWQPSDDAFSILEHAGISHPFIEDAVPEFVLYWRETGLKTSTWNTKFIAHVRRQWAKYEAALEHDATPKIIPDNYQPSEEVYEVLAMANIDETFAREHIPEFILYWKERKEVAVSWHTKFLQHIKYKWSHRESNEEDFIDRVTDRSWAN